MPYILGITCSKCDFRQVDFIPFVALEAYLLEDGSVIRVPNRVAWCEQCKQVVRAEEVPDLRELERQLDRQKRIVSPSLEFGWPQELFLQEAELACAWRKTRKSPPKCLTCGSDKITVDCRRTDLVKSHPACGGRLQFRGSGHMKLLGPMSLRLLSSEGEVLGKEMEDPFWVKLQRQRIGD